MVRVREYRTLFRALICTLSGKRPEDKTRGRWVHIIQRDPKDLGLWSMDGTGHR